MDSTNDEDVRRREGGWGSEPTVSFLRAPQMTAEVQHLYDEDQKELGFIMNASTVWAHDPAAHDELFALFGRAVSAATLSYRQRGVLISACASTLGDSYCSLAWGTRLANVAGADIAAGVLRGDDDLLDAQDKALARWARLVTRDPNATSINDVHALRDAGFDDTQIFAITLFVSLRIAFSTVNDALGARPDRMLADNAPAAVRDVVGYGRPIGAAGA